MKAKTLVLSLCGLVGCALSAGAAVDINVGGVEYAVTTVTSSTFPTSSLLSTLESQPFYSGLYNNGGNIYNSVADQFAQAYYNAVSAAGGDIMDAENTDFAFYYTPSSSLGAYLEYDDYNGQQTMYPATPVNQPYIFAEAVAVPEPTVYTGATACLLLGVAGVSTLRKSRNRFAA